ncbi:MAG: GxxExxY protein [Candidatus Muiribacterium halophilum]|uniref:GxxExxY protein n=1 Tax=Muiribacterium halophilum TaxID=2053465 RepID=A0A2N5Z9W8_MUIH1|nr:MAG: GxxExxY protein [Candidatus Muirbacterium halophilum]
MGLLYKEESYEIRKAIFEVYNSLGSGFLESVYQEALEIEFENQKIPFCSQKNIDIRYKKTLLKQKYKADFICFDKIIVEIKAQKDLHPKHQAQLFNYLNATDLKLGFLVNFGSFPKAEIQRFVRNKQTNKR